MLTEILDNDVIFNNQLSADSLSASGYIFGSLDIKNLNHSNAVDGQVVAWLASISSYIPVTKDTTIFADANKNIKLDNSIINGVGTYTPYAWGVYNFSIDKENEIFSEGLHHTAYITHNGELKLKGKNDYGQLGINPRDVKIFIDFQTPENAIASQKWSSVTCGNYYTLALDVDGYAWSWGLNTSGQLGKTDNEPSKINNKKWIKLLTGYGTSGGIDEDNRLFLWGKNTNILLDRDTDMHTPEGLQDVYAQYKWLDAAIGDGFIAGIDEDNNILTWGINREGQLGNGDSTGVRSVLGDIVNIDFKKWKSVKCTRKSVCALTTDGDIYTWGSGAQGCIGVGNNSNTPLPVKVSHPSNKNWINISSCNNTIAALDEDYKLFIWGYAYKRSTIESVPETKNIPNTNLKLSITEITVGQWREYCEHLGLNFVKETWQDDSHPVVNITTEQAKQYCRWLSASTGKIWRLPTLSEWQMAAGPNTYPWGNDYPSITSNIQYQLSLYGHLNTGSYKNFKYTSPVKQKQSNVNGFYDIVGNVSEWVDVYGKVVACGSNYGDIEQDKLKNTFFQEFQNESYCSEYIGFRVVCEELVNGHHMKKISDTSDTYLDRYETTIKQWREFINEVNYNKQLDINFNSNSCPVLVKSGSFTVPNGIYKGNIPNPQQEIYNWNVLLKTNSKFINISNKLTSILPIKNNDYSMYVHNGNLYLHIDSIDFNGVVKWDGLNWNVCLLITDNNSIDSTNISFKNCSSKGMRIGESEYVPWGIVSNSEVYPLPLLSQESFKSRWCNDISNSREYKPDTVSVDGTNTQFAKTLVTISQWKKFLADTGWSSNTSWKNVGFLQTDDEPVVNINYFDAQEYCKWLSMRTGEVWRLPSVIEWQKAAGLNVYPYESNIWPPGKKYANLGIVDDFKYTSPVGSFNSNSLGLFDMSGNVWEMCVQNSDTIILKGGSWKTTDQNIAKTLSNIEADKNNKSNDVGFRVVRENSLSDAHPVVNISYNDAVNYCKWLTIKTNQLWKLPTESEWLLAAGESIYPYGDTWPPTNLAGNYSNTLNDGFAFTSPVGSFLPNINDYYDMGGNVWEWLQESLDVNQAKTKGGSWQTDTENQARTQSYIYRDKAFSSSELGFRVASLDESVFESEVYNTPRECLDVEWIKVYSTNSNSIFAQSRDGNIYNIQNHNFFQIPHLTLLNTVVKIDTQSAVRISECKKFNKNQFNILFDDKQSVVCYANFVDEFYKEYGLTFKQTSENTGILYTPRDITNARKVSITLYSNYIELTAIGSDSFNWYDVPFYNTENFTFQAGGVVGSDIFITGKDNVIFRKNTQSWIDESQYMQNTAYTQSLNFNDDLYFLGVNGALLKISNNEKYYVNWGNSNTINDICNKGIDFVAVGSSGTIARTLDFEQWSFIDLNKKVDLRSIAFFNNNFIGVGNFCGAYIINIENQNILKLNIPQAISGGTRFNKIRVLNSKCFICGNNSTLLSSTDGDVWSAVKLPTNNKKLNIKFLKYINGLYFAIADRSIFWSRDGEEWLERLPDIDADIIDVFTGGSNLYILNANGTITIGR